MKEHRGRIYDLKINEDNENPKAVSASQDGSVIIWNLRTFVRDLCVIESTNFKSVVYHPDQSQMVTCGSDRKISVWDVYSGECIREREGTEDGDTNYVAVTSNGSAIASVGEDRLVKLWDYDSGRVIAQGSGHSGAINRCAISPNNEMIVSVGDDNSIFVW